MASLEKIIPGQASPEAASPDGVELRTFASERSGASGFSTGTATFSAGGELPYHTHPFSEVITILEGTATVVVEGRVYELSALDSLHVPEGVAHAVRNLQAVKGMTAHWAFASSQPVRVFVQDNYPLENRHTGNPGPHDPETIRRFAIAERYELAKGALFVDLFAKRFGAKGICGGYGRFEPGASLPCHSHVYDESITIVEGRALCLVQGRRYQLSSLDTAFVPTGRPHRFFNDSDVPMAMLWVYAGDEPERVLVDAGFCDGTLK